MSSTSTQTAEQRIRFALQLLNGASLKSPPVQQATAVLQELVNELDVMYRREQDVLREKGAPGVGQSGPRVPFQRSVSAFGPIVEPAPQVDELGVPESRVDGVGPLSDTRPPK